MDDNTFQRKRSCSKQEKIDIDLPIFWGNSTIKYTWFCVLISCIISMGDVFAIAKVCVN